MYHRVNVNEISEEGKLVWNSPEETKEILISAYETYLDFTPLFDEYLQF